MPTRYSPTEYFAYVEATDVWGLDESWADLPPAGADEPTEFAWLRRLVWSRGRAGLAWPSHAVWLDCVRSDYIDELPWRDEPCEIGNAAQSRQRRERIVEFDASRFRIALLLVGTRDLDGRGVAPFTEDLWHRVELGAGDLPVVTAADYEFGPGEPLADRLQYVDRCSEPERRWLVNVFSLNFLPDAGGAERGGAGPPSPEPGGPAGGGGDARETLGQQRYATQALFKLKARDGHR